MKRILVIPLCTIILCACNVLQATGSEPVGHDFPLETSWVYETQDAIKVLTTSNDWLAVATSSQIIAVDSQTGNPLWEQEFSISSTSTLLMTRDLLIAQVTGKGVLVFDKKGDWFELDLQPSRGSSQLVAAHENYVYLIRTSSPSGWILEVYDLVENSFMWDALIPKGSKDIHFDARDDNTYITTREFIRAYTIQGALLWEKASRVTRSTYSHNQLYTHEDVNNQYAYVSRNVTDQATAWLSLSETAATEDVISMELMPNRLLVTQTRLTLIGINSEDGRVIWHSSPGDQFHSAPVELNNYIYARGSSKTIYAIDPKTGSSVGYLETGETQSFLFEVAEEAFYGVYRSSGKLLFNTANFVYAYDANP